MPGQNFLDDVSNDLALWIDETASDIALAFAPARAPFSAKVTEEAKLEYYRAKLFNPDGTPNAQGRAQEIQRLGAEGFGAVYKAVVARYPELKVAPPPPIEVPDQWPTAAPGPPPGGAGPGLMPPGPPGGPPGLPPGPPVPAMGPPQPPIMPRPMAKGGIVTEPTLALIGEAGPEAVVPLADPRLQNGLGAGGLGPANPQAGQISPWDELIKQHAGDYAADPRFVQTVAAAARAESTDDPRAYQLGYDPNDPKTWQQYGGRGLWQFDINKGAKGYGVPEQQLLDPTYQASVIVPEYVKTYQQVTADIAAGRRKPMTDAELASLVAGMTEFPYKWNDPNSDARRNYVRAYNELSSQTG